MNIEEISFREWVVCKVRWRSMTAETRAPLSEVPVPVSEIAAPLNELPEPASEIIAATGESFRRKGARSVRSFKMRRAGDRRLDDLVGSYTGKERRRVPERRIPEVEETSFAEFERWKSLAE